jgi:hypothetical protein
MDVAILINRGGPVMWAFSGYLKVVVPSGAVTAASNGSLPSEV